MVSAGRYAAARERLAGVTDDAAVLEALDRLSETDERGDHQRTDEALLGFLEHARRLNLSLDFIFIGAGKPYRQ